MRNAGNRPPESRWSQAPGVAAASSSFALFSCPLGCQPLALNPYCLTDRPFSIELCSHDCLRNNSATFAYSSGRAPGNSNQLQFDLITSCGSFFKFCVI